MTSDELGRRRFQIRKEKAVEDAFEKIRHGMGSEWSSISADDSDVLKMVLGEIWMSIDRPRWATYCFSKLSAEDIRSLIALGREITAGKSFTDDMLNAMDHILSCTL
jgi:hypothetical protein